MGIFTPKVPKSDTERAMENQPKGKGGRTAREQEQYDNAVRLFANSPDDRGTPGKCETCGKKTTADDMYCAKHMNGRGM